MTVSSDFAARVYVANGVTTTFDWGEDYDETYGSLVVTKIDNNGNLLQTYVQGTDYQISNKQVVFYQAPASGVHIRLNRCTYRGQPVSFMEGEKFPAKDFENALDRFAMIEQEQDKSLSDEISARQSADTVIAAAIPTKISDLTNDSGFVAVTDLATVATTGSYNDLIDTPSIPDAQVQSDWSQSDNTKVDFIKNKPSIPTVNNATITFTQGGVSKGSITLNQSSDETIALDAGGGGGEAVWGSITGTLADQTDLNTALAGKQSVIDSSHKLSADLVDDTSTTNKFVTASEKTAIGTALQPADITNMQVTTNLVTSVSSSSTDSQYPSAKLFYDTCGDIETLINAL